MSENHQPAANADKSTVFRNAVGFASLIPKFWTPDSFCGWSNNGIGARSTGSGKAKSFGHVLLPTSFHGPLSQPLKHPCEESKHSGIITCSCLANRRVARKAARVQGAREQIASSSSSMRRADRRRGKRVVRNH